MTSAGTRHLADRLRGTPAVHVADQVLSSGTNFLAVVVVARNGTPNQFGMFSILLLTFAITAGFNRAVPHAVAMTMEWDDERARSGYFFLPPLAIGPAATAVLMATFAVMDPSWALVPLVLLPLLLQDAVRMHAFAVGKPLIALRSDVVWLVVEICAFLLVSSAVGAVWAWGLGGLCALVVAQPWRTMRFRLQRRPVKNEVVSAALEFATLSGLGYLTPILASPIVTIVGVAALQGANVIRGPINLVVQGLMVHRMSGPPISPSTSLHEARRLSATTLALALVCTPPLFLLRGFYGPRLLGSTWPEVEPLVLPACVAMVLGSVPLGPATVARKMGFFTSSAKLQGALSPVLLGFPLLGAAVAGTTGFLYATAAGYAVWGLVWWTMLPRLAAAAVSGIDRRAGHAP